MTRSSIIFNQSQAIDVQNARLTKNLHYVKTRSEHCSAVEHSNNVLEVIEKGDLVADDEELLSSTCKSEEQQLILSRISCCNLRSVHWYSREDNQAGDVLWKSKTAPRWQKEQRSSNVCRCQCCLHLRGRGSYHAELWGTCDISRRFSSVEVYAAAWSTLNSQQAWISRLVHEEYGKCWIRVEESEKVESSGTEGMFSRPELLAVENVPTSIQSFGCRDKKMKNKAQLNVINFVWALQVSRWCLSD